MKKALIVINIMRVVYELYQLSKQLLLFFIPMGPLEELWSPELSNFCMILYPFFFDHICLCPT